VHSLQGLGYGLEAQEIVVPYMPWESDLSLLQSVQTGSGTHSASYSMDTEGSFLVGMVAGGITTTIHPHLVPGLSMSGAILPLPHTFSWHAQGHLYIYLLQLPIFLTA
jgi:hypothetical protein